MSSSPKTKQYCKELVKIHGIEPALRLMENTLLVAVGKTANFFKEVIIELKREKK